jgi:hypothetical protein
MGISKYNPDGYLDMTAYLALKNIEKERKKQPRTPEQKEQQRRCWECTRCNYCSKAFKISGPCVDFKQRKRRTSK